MSRVPKVELERYLAQYYGGAVSEFVPVDDAAQSIRHACIRFDLTGLKLVQLAANPVTLPTGEVVYTYYCNACGKLIYYRDPNFTGMYNQGVMQ